MERRPPQEWTWKGHGAAIPARLSTDNQDLTSVTGQQETGALFPGHVLKNISCKPDNPERPARPPPQGTENENQQGHGCGVDPPGLSETLARVGLGQNLPPLRPGRSKPAPQIYLVHELLKSQRIPVTLLAVAVRASSEAGRAHPFHRNDPGPFPEELGDTVKHLVDQGACLIQAAKRTGEGGTIGYDIQEAAEDAGRILKVPEPAVEPVDVGRGLGTRVAREHVGPHHRQR